MKDQLFGKYHGRVNKEAIIKSVMFGLIVGSSVMLVTSLLTWFFGFRGGLWLAIGLFAAGFVVTSLLLYFLKFRPTTKQIAVRVDSLGLEERLITMYELQGDNSYIAQRQREDAVHAMKSVDSMLIKIVVSTVLIVSLAVSLLLGLVGGTTVSSLYFAGAIPSGVDLVSGNTAEYTFRVTYGVATGEETGAVILWEPELITGYAEGEEPTVVTEPLTVKQGDDAPAVIAVPNESDGYVFICWSDGNTQPYRHDLDIQGNLKVTAMFANAGFSTEYLPDNLYEDGDDTQQGDSPILPWDDLQKDSGMDKPKDEDDEDSDVEDSEFDFDKSASQQQIIDGQNYYGDYFDDYYQQMQERLGSNNNIPPEVKSWINDYFKGVNAGKETDDEGGSEGGSQEGGN